jgi:hypothetical protein
VENLVEKPAESPGVRWTFGRFERIAQSWCGVTGGGTPLEAGQL